MYDEGLPSPCVTHVSAIYMEMQQIINEVPRSDCCLACNSVTSRANHNTTINVNNLAPRATCRHCVKNAIAVSLSGTQINEFRFCWNSYIDHVTIFLQGIWTYINIT